MTAQPPEGYVAATVTWISHAANPHLGRKLTQAMRNRTRTVGRGRWQRRRFWYWENVVARLLPRVRINRDRSAVNMSTSLGVGFTFNFTHAVRFELWNLRKGDTIHIQGTTGNRPSDLARALNPISDIRKA